MKEVIRVERVYDFDDLTDSAKKNARSKFCDHFKTSDDFTEICLEELKQLFPNSDLQVEYSLSFSQGDGLNVYGELDVRDAIKFALHDKGVYFDKNNIRFLKFVAKNGYTLNLSENKTRYSFCWIWHNDLENEVVDLLERDGYIRGLKEKKPLIKDFVTILSQKLENLCKKFERMGYDYFYTTEDEEIKEMWDINGYSGWDVNGNPLYC